VPLSDIPALPLDARKVIARRAALELFPGAICNLGSGISTGIANVAAEEGVLDAVCLTNEQGLIGGAPASGGEAGASRNYAAMIDQPYQFDFYDGGGLDLAFLSFAEIDREGNVNVSRAAASSARAASSTSARTPRPWCSAAPSAGRDGERPKLVEAVEQITFSGRYAQERGQRVLYVTERAVFRLSERGVELVEIAPGLDLERDVLGRMRFRPAIAAKLTTMDQRLFRPEPMALARDLAARPARAGSARLALLDAFSAAAE
jgi:propionate CoA-transferase